MKIKLLVIGKTEEAYLQTGIREYAGRVKHYVPFEITEIPALKNVATLSREQQNAKEAEAVTRLLQPGDVVVLLDERGKELRSVDFATFLNRQFVSGAKNLVFVVGGPFGFDPSLKNMASSTLSLSRMTFSHQMVRLFFTEQLYRALSILRGGSYHHE
jgi:23S rRNA (pseudouridine1915-N3)-methyltransferase